MSEEQLVKENLKLDNPDFTNDEVDIYYRNTYKLDDEKHSDDEVALGKINLKRDANKARNELKSCLLYTSPSPRDS